MIRFLSMLEVGTTLLVWEMEAIASHFTQYDGYECSGSKICSVLFWLNENWGF